MKCGRKFAGTVISHKSRNLDRAKATLDSIYAHYGVAENRLLRENYPFNVDYTASYAFLPRPAYGSTERVGRLVFAALFQ